MRGLPQKQNARRADKIRLCGHLGRYKKIVKKTYIISNKYFTFFCLFFFPIHRDEPARSEPPFIYLCTHLEHRCPNRADAVRHGRTSVVKASEQRYIERAVRTSWARPVIFTTMCKKTSPDSPKAARRGIFIITNKAPASPYNDASPPASYPSPSSGGSACFSHFHPASS